MLPTHAEDDLSSLVRRLKILKGKVTEWIKKKNFSMHKELSKIDMEIQPLLASSPYGILNEDRTNLLFSLKGRKDKFLAHELLTSDLNRRIKWTNLGDANTKFFHRYASTCINFNAIWALKNEGDVLVEGTDKLKEMGVKHFSDIFIDDGKTNIRDHLKVIQLFPSLVSRDEADVFTSEVTLDEVEGALKAFKREKRSGPYGWTVEFFL